MADFEAPGLGGTTSDSHGQKPSRRQSKAAATGAELRARISGAANRIALESVRQDLETAGKKLPLNEVQELSALHDARLRALTKPRKAKKRSTGVTDKTFEEPNYIETLKTEGLAGQLAYSRFRSVAWKIYLGVLPEDVQEWKAASAKTRNEYEATRQKWIVDPYNAAADSTDLAKNNPLAIDDDAPWQRHFQDEQFRKLIQQDVHRTYPNLEFFRRADVQEDLLNVLFCYARSHPDLSYRQGMHELLAGVYHVLARDCGAVDMHGVGVDVDANGGEAAGGQGAEEGGGGDGDANGGATATADKGSTPANGSTASLNGAADGAAASPSSSSSAFDVVMNRQFLAHDAHALFSVVMETAGGWFAQTEEEVQQQRRKALDEHIPFAPPTVPDHSSKSIVMVRLDRIISRVLKGFDSELYHRLQVLDIPPQIYGLRWIRVLFAREFSVEDTFRIWDAIFADSPSLDLTDYIFVAALCYRRRELITSDVNTCLRLLMSPLEMVTDVQHIIELALHIRQPTVFPRPAPFEDAKIAAARAAAAATVNAAAERRMPTAVGVDAHHATPHTQPVHKAASLPVSPRVQSPIQSVSEASSTSVSANSSRANSTTQLNLPSPPKGAAQLMNELQGRLERLHADNAKRGLLLATYISQLKEELLATDRLPDDDVIFAALSGIGAVKDALMGNSTAI
eukprot:m.181610 g.181610  ORF g.181610 m.181610 type:complete len:684 (+) comp15318_c0_seq1:101-2152(+)